MKTALFLGIAIALCFAQARGAELAAQPVNGSGFVVKDNVGELDRSRMQESGRIMPIDTTVAVAQTQALSEALARASAKFARVMQTTNRFESEAMTKGLAGNNWRALMINRMMRGAEAEFGSVERARSLSDAMAAANVVARAAASTSATPTPQAIGAATFDLTYIPISPCRILDTRGSGGPLAAGSAQSYSYDAINPGASSACGVYSQVGGSVIPKALAINVTVDESSLSGFTAGAYLQIYPEFASTPTSFINFGPGQIVANAGVVSENQTTGRFTVFTSAPAQVIVDVYGVFVEPRATPLDCATTEMSPLALPPGAGGVATSPNCPASEVVTGGNCNADTNIELVQSSSYGNTWRCNYYNNSAASIAHIYASAICCRVPGQ